MIKITIKLPPGSELSLLDLMQIHNVALLSMFSIQTQLKNIICYATIEGTEKNLEQYLKAMTELLCP